MKPKLFHRLWALLLVLSLSVPLALPARAADGGGDGEGGSTGGDTSAVFAVTVNDLTVEWGKTGEVTAQVTPPEGVSESALTITWAWSFPGNESATLPFTISGNAMQTLTVDARSATDARVGSVLAKVEAKATYTDANGTEQTLTATDECTITVVYATPTNLGLNTSAEVVLKQGEEYALNAYLSPVEFTDKSKITWSSSAAGIVSLSALTGAGITVTGLSPGSATVTATCGTKTASCPFVVSGVVIANASGADITNGDLDLTVGTSHQLTAQGFAVDSSFAEWSSGNESVAIVSSTGEVTARSVGSTVITVTMGSFSASCTVNVAENLATTIQYPTSIEAMSPLSFDVFLTELNTLCRETLGSNLDYITNLSVPTGTGILYYGYSSSASTGLGVGVSEKYYYSGNSALGERSVADVTFVSRSDFSGRAEITYTGYSTTGSSFHGAIHIPVATDSDVAYVTGINTPVTFDSADFADVCRVKTGRSLDYVTFTLPPASRGTLYYNYIGEGAYNELVTAGTQYSVNITPKLDSVTFVPADGYSGDLTIPYTGVNTSGVSYTGQMTITVTGAGASNAEAAYSLNDAGTADLYADDFTALSKRVTGYALDYLYFTLPDAAQGTLYYNYRASSSYNTPVYDDVRYYPDAAPSLSNITFVAGEGFQDALYVYFTAYDTAGNRFYGRVFLEQGTGSSDNSIYYTGYSGLPVAFDDTDFNEVCLDATGSVLSHVYFDLPASNRGSLYYNYSSSNTAVSASYAYYRSGGRVISKVSFVPASAFSGTVGIPYTGHAQDGSTFQGTIWVTVEPSTDLTIRHTIASGGVLSLSAAEFNQACYALSGSALNYVRFTLPDSDCGVFYYKYDAETGKYSSKVSASTSFYRAVTSSTSTRRLLEDVSFVANDSFTGTVELSYTGWNTGGGKFTGTLVIVVTEPSAQTIHHTGSSLPISLSAQDFGDACTEVFGRGLSYIRFTSLPDQSAGRLYLDYRSPASPGTEAATGTNYYFAGTPSLDSLVFVPRADFEGRVTLRYVGVDAAGYSFSGDVAFTIDDAYNVNTFSDVDGFLWASPSLEFMRGCGVIQGIGDNAFNPELYMTRGDFVLLVCQTFGFNTGATETFRDVDPNKYYAWAIATAKDLGLIEGSGGLFLPQSVITRQDAMVLVQRALALSGTYLPAGSNYLLTYFSDGGQVADYAKQSVAALIQAGIITGNDLGELQPLNPIRRAEMVVLLHRIVTA